MTGTTKQIEYATTLVNNLVIKKNELSERQTASAERYTKKTVVGYTTEQLDKRAVMIASCRLAASNASSISTTLSSLLTSNAYAGDVIDCCLNRWFDMHGTTVGYHKYRAISNI